METVSNTFFSQNSQSIEKVSQELDEITKKVQDLSPRIQQATSQGTLLEKSRSLEEINATLLYADKYIRSVNKKKSQLNHEIEILREEIVKIGLQLNGEIYEQGQTDRSLKKKLDNKNLILSQKSDLIEKFSKICTSSLDSLISDALVNVKTSLRQIDKVIIKVDNTQDVEVSLKKLVQSSKVFKNHFKLGMKGSELGILHLKFDSEVEIEEIQAYVNFFKTGTIDLTHENVMPIFTLANRDDVVFLLKLCVDFFNTNASWDSFPNLLNAGVETNQPTLIWDALCLAMTNQEALSKKDFTDIKYYTFFSNSTKTILNDLQELATLEPRIEIFNYCSGYILINEYSEKLSSLININNFIPLWFHFRQPDFTIENIKSLSKTCPFLEHLTVACEYETIVLLQDFKKLKSFGNTLIALESFDDIEKYQNDLSPITLNTLILLDIENYETEAYTEPELENYEIIRLLNCKGPYHLISSNAKLVILNKCSNIHIINTKNALVIFENLKENSICIKKAKKVSFRNSLDLKEFKGENVELLEFINCPFLNFIDAPETKRIRIENPKKDLKILAPYNCQIVYEEISPSAIPLEEYSVETIENFSDEEF